MIGLDVIPVDAARGVHLHPSDHFGLQLFINLRVRRVSERSALVLLPFDVELCCPFFELTDTDDDEDSILLPLRLLLTQCRPLDVEAENVALATDSQTDLLPLNSISSKNVKQLRAQIEQLFSHCLPWESRNFTPKMIVRQAHADKKLEPFYFTARYVSILKQLNGKPPHTVCQLPIGPVLEPLRFTDHFGVSADLRNFFQQMDLYESEQSYARKHDKLQRLSAVLADVFSANAMHCYTYAFLPYGSFRLVSLARAKQTSSQLISFASRVCTVTISILYSYSPKTKPRRIPLTSIELFVDFVMTRPS